MAITIERATAQPVENEDFWSYPIEELDYLLSNEENDGARYLLWENRLYETARD